MANEQFVFLAANVVNGLAEAFNQTQAATIEEFERGAVASQVDVGQQIMHLLAGERGRKAVVVLGADLGKDRPLRLAEQNHK